MKKAFTLVEILVVASIISLLASIAAVSYSQFIKQSRDTRRKTDIEQIRAAIELYRNFNGLYPTGAPGGSMTFGTGSIVDGGGTKYMTKIPQDPSSSSNTYYYGSTGAQDYALCAYLEAGGTATALSCGATYCNYCMGPYGQL